MQHRDFDKRPSRPVIPSYAGAIAQAEAWLKANDYHLIHDGDGLAWNLKVKTVQLPRRDSIHGTHWEMTLMLTAEVSGEGFQASGTLERKKDERLLELLGEDRVPLAMRPIVYMAVSDEEAKTVMAEALFNLKRDMAQKKLHELKRSLISRWLDQRALFHSATLSPTSPVATSL